MHALETQDRNNGEHCDMAEASYFDTKYHYEIIIEGKRNNLNTQNKYVHLFYNSI